MVRYAPPALKYALLAMRLIGFGTFFAVQWSAQNAAQLNALIVFIDTATENSEILVVCHHPLGT